MSIWGQQIVDEWLQLPSSVQNNSLWVTVRFEAQTECGILVLGLHVIISLVVSPPASPAQPSPAQQATKPGHSNLSCNLIFTRLHAHSFYALSIAWTNFQLFSSHQCSGQLTLNTVITHFQTSQSWQHFCRKTQSSISHEVDIKVNFNLDN